MRNKSERRSWLKWQTICLVLFGVSIAQHSHASDCNEALEISVEKTQTSVCSDNQEPLPFSAEVTTGSGDFTFHWSFRAIGENNWTELSTDKSITVHPNIDTEYQVFATAGKCQSNTETFTVNVREAIRLSLPSADTIVCQEANLTVKSRVEQGKPTQFLWDGEASDEPIHTLVGIKNDMTLTLRATDGVCLSEELEYAITVRDSTKFTMGADQTICLGQEAAIRVKLREGKASAYKYYKKEEGGNQEEFTPEGRNIDEAPKKTTTYTVTVESDACPNVTQTSTVTVVQPPKLTLATADGKTQVCKGEEIGFVLSTENCENFQWEVSGIQSVRTQVINEGDPLNKTLKLNENSMVRVVSTDETSTCPRGASNEIYIDVSEPVQVKIAPMVRTICANDSIRLEATLLSGASDKNGWIKITEEGEMEIAQNLTTSDRPTQSAKYVAWAQTATCPTATDTVNIQVETPYTPSISVSSLNICAGDEIAVNGTVGNAAALKWLRRDSSEPVFVCISEEHSNSITDRPLKNATYCLVTTGLTACPDKWSDTITVRVEKPTEISLEATDTVCQGESVLLKATSNIDPKLIKWERINKDGKKELHSSTAQIKETINQRTTYTATAASNTCPSASDTIVVEVDTIPDYSVVASTDSICEGDELALTTDFPYTTHIKWEKSRLTQNDYTPIGEGEDEIVFVPTESAKYRMTAKTDFGCKTQANPIIVNFSRAIFTRLGDTAVCEGNELDLSFFISNAYQYEWAKDPEHTQRIPHEEMTTFRPTEPTTYYLRMRNGACQKEMPLHVDVVPFPSIANIEQIGYHGIRIEAEGGTGNYTYNFGQGFVDSDVFEHIRYSSTYKIQVRDAAGCMTDTTISTPDCDIEIPQLFTPNGDGENDLFVITNLEKFIAFDVKIFDRHGKLIYQQDETSEPWDGTSNGHAMPSDDYWYIINIEEQDNIYQGHFTLIR